MAGRPSRWELAHILVLTKLCSINAGFFNCLWSLCFLTQAQPPTYKLLVIGLLFDQRISTHFTYFYLFSKISHSIILTHFKTRSHIFSFSDLAASSTKRHLTDGAKNNIVGLIVRHSYTFGNLLNINYENRYAEKASIGAALRRCAYYKH